MTLYCNSGGSTPISDSAPSVKPADLQLLWAKAAGRCANPACRRKLALDAPIGEAAHIYARRPAGPRGQGGLTPDQLNRVDNLILLCPLCHTKVDKESAKFPPELLLAWKEEHEAWVATLSESTPSDLLWTAILQDPDSQIDPADAKAALGRGHRVAHSLLLTGAPPKAAGADWSAAAAQDRRALEALLADTPAKRRRFVVFSMAPIPLAVHLGFVLGDRSNTQVRHYDRDRCTWSWNPDVPPPADDLTYAVTECFPGGAARICVSLSAAIDPIDVAPAAIDIQISVPDPNVRWLRHPAQLTALRTVYARALSDARRLGAGHVHLYLAGPTASAIEFGRAYNASMNPAMELYQYSRATRPRYEAVLRLNG
jgi:hypothetical protein